MNKRLVGYWLVTVLFCLAMTAGGTMNLMRTEINSPDVQTVFHDQTVPPGRWTLNLNGTKLDIMEARIILNHKIEGGPSDILEVR